MEATEQYQLGHKRERQFRDMLARRGAHVLSAYAADEGDKAPIVHTSGRSLVAPDVLAIKESGLAYWFEVKAKAVPGYMWKRGRFEHGIDLYLFADHYRRIAEKASVWLVVCESETLPEPGWTPARDWPPPDGQGGRDWQCYVEDLVEGPTWLAIQYQEAARIGREESNWTSEDEPGWLWPRDAMTELDWTEIEEVCRE